MVMVRNTNRRGDLIGRELMNRSIDEGGKTRLDDERLNRLINKMLAFLDEKDPSEWTPQHWAFLNKLWNDKKTQKVQEQTPAESEQKDSMSSDEADKLLYGNP